MVDQLIIEGLKVICFGIGGIIGVGLVIACLLGFIYSELSEILKYLKSKEGN